jgi:hypothetical protein
LNASAGLDPPPGQRGDGATAPAPSRAAAAVRPGLPSVSGSRRLDLLAFLLLACLVVGLSHWRMRVYHQITVWEVSLTRVAPDGTRHDLASPEHLRRSSAAGNVPSQALASLEHGIRLYMQGGPATQHADAGDRFEWRIRYSYNSTVLDQQRLLVFEADGSERR